MRIGVMKDRLRDSSVLDRSTPTGKRFLSVLGIGIFALSGVIIAKAENGPQIREVFLEYSRPIRKAAQQQVSNVQAYVPQVFRGTPRAQQQVQPQSLPRAERTSLTKTNAPQPYMPRGGVTLPTPALSGNEGMSNSPNVIKVRRDTQPIGQTRASVTSMSYCVRLCDGFAFPLAQSGAGSPDAHEAACKLACPGAQTAVFTLPAGAQSFDAAYRGPMSYTQLPAAYRFRDKLDQACTCRGVGATQSSAALLTDFTLRRGDLVMTRVGVRHFDGTQRFPYRSEHFSDGLAKSTNASERKQLAAMEAASVRGIMPGTAPSVLRNRVAREMRDADALARTQSGKLAEVARSPSAFLELKAPQRLEALSTRAPGSAQRIIVLN